VQADDRQIDVVVVDDGSTDDTSTAVTAIPDERVRFVPQDHLGVAVARNRGVAETDAKYVSFLDSDDVAVPGWLDALFRAAEREVDIFSCGVTFLDGNDRTNVAPTPQGRAFCNVTALFLAGSFMTRRELFEQVGGYLAGLAHGENTDLGMRLSALHRDTPLHVESVETPLVEVRRRPNRYDASVMWDAATLVLRERRDLLAADPRMLANYMAIGGTAARKLGRNAEARRLHAQAVRTDPRNWRHSARLVRSVTQPIVRRLRPGAERG
jgi:glycosyltransferase involved in cell wall biosynthesis